MTNHEARNLVKDNASAADRAGRNSSNVYRRKYIECDKYCFIQENYIEYITNSEQINNIQYTFFDTRCLDVCAQSATCNHYSSLTGYVLRD